MTETPTAPAAPAVTLESALAGIRAVIAAQPEPAKTDLTNALRWLEPAIEAEVDTAIMAYANKVPLAGSFIGGIVVSSFNKALEAGLVDLTGPAA